MESPPEQPTAPVDQPDPRITNPHDLTGRTLGDFQLIRRIGQGGMGQVYLARQLSLKRQVAVKILRADLASNTTALKRFQLEAEAVAKITHANIVQVYAIGEADGLNYMALEYVEGRNLRDHIHRKGPPDLPIALNIMRQIAAALHRAGELGFVHRDIKPENILLSRKGEVKVADFGLSRCFDAERQPMNLTQSGVTMGTPLYMSPEQVRGQTVDPRSDIYSFGVSSYHMLAGEPPFKGETPFEVALQHVQKEPEPLGDIRPDLPAELCAIVHRMMNKRPEDRYQTAREVLRDLTRLKEGLSISVGQAALTQSGSSRSNGIPLSLSSTTADESQAVPTAPSRWRQWILVAASFLCAGSVGAAIHWGTSLPLERKLVETDLALNESIPNPARAIEKDLQKRLKEHGIKSDLEVTNALLELALLHTHEKRYQEALRLFEMSRLREWPALVEAQKTFQFPGLYFQMLSQLGKGIVLAQADSPDESNAEFKNALLAKGKVALKQPPVDLFLWKYDRWKKAVADALERNSKNKNGAKLEESLNRYRHYSKAP